MAYQYWRKSQTNFLILKGMLALVAIQLITGCASGYPFRKEPVSNNSQSLLYIYRPAQFFAIGMAPDIYINDKKSLTIVNGGYSVIRIAPGHYRVEVKKLPALLALNGDIASFVEFGAESGRSYYVRWLPNMYAHGYFFGSSKLVGNMMLLAEESAIPEISRCNYLVPEIPEISPATDKALQPGNQPGAAR
jgi:hypothetical protein